MNISEPVEKSVLSAKAKDILLNKGIVTIGELFSAKGKQFSEIINENSDIAKELEGFIRRNAEQAERAGISIDYDLWLFANEKYVHMYANISFEKQPSINFGTFDFDKELDLLVRMLSPVSQKELIDYIYLEYGFEKNTTASKLSVISKYCHNGVYNVDYKKMPENRLQIMKNNLNEPFYYLDEVKDKYSLLFANADRDEINPYTLKKMGFHVLSKYILSEKYESLREYFIDLLTKNDVIKISDFTRRYTNVQMYYQTLSELKKSYKIIQADADTYISFRKLEEKGIALDDIHEFCNKVYATVNDGEYFTIHSIRSYGFTDIFENAGFGEYLCSALLACDSRFDSQSIFLSIVLSKNNEIGQISKKSFIKSCLSENVPCSPKKLIESVYNKYGVRITDKYEITEAIKNSNFCYDDIIDEIYAIE